MNNSFIATVAKIRRNAANTENVACALDDLAQFVACIDGRIINKRVIDMINSNINTDILSVSFDREYFMYPRDGYKKTSSGIDIESQNMIALDCIRVKTPISIKGYDKYDSALVLIAPHTDKTSDRIDAQTDAQVIQNAANKLHEYALSMRARVDGLAAQAVRMYDIIAEFNDIKKTLCDFVERDWFRMCSSDYISNAGIPVNSCMTYLDMRDKAGNREKYVMDNFTTVEYETIDNGENDWHKYEIYHSLIKLITPDGQSATYCEIEKRWIG